MKTKSVNRFDKGELQSAEKTPQGFLRVPIFATRAGVFTYKTGEGKIIREFRPPDEVFKEDSLSTLVGAPVTLRHPPEMITPENVSLYQKGYALESINRDGDKVSGTIIISHADAIGAVESDGMREVSCGYTADLVEEPGVYQGQAYDFIQRNIKYNHIAIVDKGRAGPDVRIRLDSEDAVMEVEPIQNPKPKKKEEISMGKVRLDGKEHEVTSEVQAAVEADQAVHQKTKTDLDSANSTNATLKKENSELTTKATSAETKLTETDAKLEANQAKLDAANEELKKRTDSVDPSDAKVREFAKARMSLEKIAAHVLPQEQIEKMDSMSDVEIKKAIIQADSPTAILDGKSEIYLETRFDSVAEKIRARSDLNTNFGNAVVKNDSRNEAAPDSDEKRKQMRKDSEDEWKKPLSATK